MVTERRPRRRHTIRRDRPNTIRRATTTASADEHRAAERTMSTVAAGMHRPEHNIRPPVGRPCAGTCRFGLVSCLEGLLVFPPRSRHPLRGCIARQIWKPSCWGRSSPIAPAAVARHAVPSSRWIRPIFKNRRGYPALISPRRVAASMRHALLSAGHGSARGAGSQTCPTMPGQIAPAFLCRSISGRNRETASKPSRSAFKCCPAVRR